MTALRQMLKPAQLRLLVAIDEHRQLVQAADAVGMTQPAASRMLAEIERQLGATLFLRQPRGMVPTEIGQAVLQRAALILHELTSMVVHLEHLRDGLGGSVRVGSVTGPAVSILVAAVRKLKKIAPRADVTIDVLPSRDLLAHLVAGDIDFALARNLPEYDSQQFTITPMLDEHVSLLARAAHPLARAPVVTLTELQSYQWVMQQRGAPIREAVLAAFSDLGLPEPGQVINSASTLLALAYLADSDAIAPVSREVADLFIRPPIQAGYISLTLPNEIRVPPYYLLQMQRRQLSALAGRLRGLVIAESRAVAAE